MNNESHRTLFFNLYKASTEKEVDIVLDKYSSIFNDSNNWYPLGNNEGNFGLVEAQQSSSIASLIEKITNSIDAILMKKCYEAGINPKSPDAPKTMQEAIETFYDSNSDCNYENWNLSSFRQKQAEEIQIHADGPKMETSLIIYDNGEGQHPEDFEKTFLSLLKGNKNEIHFVQGKYNMGGTGAIVFCGRKRYQLIASKRYDNTGNFGFTLIREHPITKEELKGRRNSWYEYSKIDDEIPNFPIDKLDVGLLNRKFKTGSIIKLYSYSLPSGSRSVISRDLNLSINEFLFKPALPLYTIDKPERYPKDKNLERELFGAKFRLEKDDSRYIEDFFSENYESAEIGKFKITCYIFKSKVEGKTVKETKETISREFFKNNMVVLFSQNGQTHGHYTNEFITRTLKMPLLKSHLLIHVDCTHLQYQYKKELFMADRERLKDSEETRKIRTLLASILSKGKLHDIYKKRKDSISMEPGDTNELLKSFTKSIPLNSELMKLLKNTFKIDIASQKNKDKKRRKDRQKKDEEIPFEPKRFPSFFTLFGNGSEEMPVAKIPLEGMKSVKFLTDAENQFFDRVEDSGDMQLSLLSFKPNDTQGGDKPGNPKKLSDLLNINRASPNNGTIKIIFNPTKEVNIGDMIQIKASLTGPGVEFEEYFWVKIVDKEKPKKKKDKEEDKDKGTLGLPQYHLVYREKKEKSLSWEEFELNTGAEMDFSTVIHPLVEGDNLDSIYINMDSNVLKTHKSKIRNITDEQIDLADKKYFSSVYFHTLFLYTITRNRNYLVKKGEEDIGIDDFLKDVFTTYYAEFLINFGTEHLMESLDI